MTTGSLMVLGTMSSAGKSLVAAGLCRLYARRGIRAAPFKAQNMSNNAAVCSGGEIGQAQAVQAAAAGVEPSVHMNPILLKPESDSRSQVVVHGQMWDALTAARFYERREDLRRAVVHSLDYLLHSYDLIIMEGAGSPAEMNLYKHDLVNLFPARHAGAPCLLVGDIDRGGIFAQLLGTLWLLEDDDRPFIRGLLPNKFRGDPNLFADGIRFLEHRSSLPVLGLLPYLHDHGIPDEDAASLSGHNSPSGDAQDIAVVRLPHISNFDDFDPLAFEPGVHLRYVSQPGQLGSPAAVILPGTKNTLEDLDWLHRSGFTDAIRTLADRGASIVGLCGGFQMLGESVHDESGLESILGKVEGLGLLPNRTRLQPAKTVSRSRGTVLADCGFLNDVASTAIHGYEIHLGLTSGSNPLFHISQREGSAVDVPDGGCSGDGRIWGTYLHGVFDNDAFRRAWLESLGVQPSTDSFQQRRTRSYDRLADVLEENLNIDLLDRIIEEGV